MVNAGFITVLIVPDAVMGLAGVADRFVPAVIDVTVPVPGVERQIGLAAAPWVERT